MSFLRYSPLEICFAAILVAYKVFDAEGSAKLFLMNLGLKDYESEGRIPTEVFGIGYKMFELCREET